MQNELPMIVYFVLYVFFSSEVYKQCQLFQSTQFHCILQLISVDPLVLACLLVVFNHLEVTDWSLSFGINVNGK